MSITSIVLPNSIIMKKHLIIILFFTANAWAQQQPKSISYALEGNMVERPIGFQHIGELAENTFRNKANDSLQLHVPLLYIKVLPFVDLTEMSQHYPKWLVELERMTDFHTAILFDFDGAAKHIRVFTAQEFPPGIQPTIVLETFITKMSLQHGSKKPEAKVYFGVDAHDSIWWAEANIGSSLYKEVSMTATFRARHGESCKQLTKFSEKITHIDDSSYTDVVGLRALVPPIYQGGGGIYSPLKSDESMMIRAQNKLIQAVFNRYTFHLNRLIKRREIYHNLDKPGSTSIF